MYFYTCKKLPKERSTCLIRVQQMLCLLGNLPGVVLFVVTVELLSTLIRHNQKIEGILINDENFKISQFADDTSFSITNNDQNIEEIFRSLKMFESVWGLKVNTDKTEGVLFGQSTIYNFYCW